MLPYGPIRRRGRSAPACVRESTRMRLRVVAGTLAALGMIAGSIAELKAGSGPSAPGYRVEPLTRASVVSSVTASGTLVPYQSVVVGVPTGNTLEAVTVDINASVHAGDVLARLDPTTAQSHLAQARTDLAVAQGAINVARQQHDRAMLAVSSAEAVASGAQNDRAHAQDVLADAERDLTRAQTLARTGDAARIEIERAQAALAQAKWSVASAEARASETQNGIASAKADVLVAGAQLDNLTAGLGTHEEAVHNAELELAATQVRAPIDGIVLDDNAVAGQTGQAAQFTIASDLHRLLLHANVNEGDIGRVALGQEASFGVDSYPGETFAGRVFLVKRAPQTVQNVVTYDVVIEVGNPDERLLPGMTATTRIVTARAEDALRAPSAALRFTPTGVPAPEGAVVWTVSGDGGPVPHHVETGVSDGAFTAIEAEDLHQGDAVVVGVAAKGDGEGHHRSLLGL